MKQILFTGGGSSGHVTPNLAIIPKLIDRGYSISYIGAKTSIEQEIIERNGIAFHGIQAGKLRRYFSWQNFTDLFRIVAGTIQSFFIIRKIKPSFLFSKGGFVSCPVVWAAWLNRVPIMIHESDISPGLANRLASPFANKICITFPESQGYFSTKKQLLTGLPLRDFLNQGDAEKGRAFCGFDKEKPVILIIGGSLGSVRINQVIREALPELLPLYQVAHICGKGKIDQSLQDVEGYRQFDYINESLPDVFAIAKIIISRAGSTTINEIRQLKKLNLLIPLSKQASRGDQILNAASFEKQGLSKVLQEEDLSQESLLAALTDLQQNEREFEQNLSKMGSIDSSKLILEEIENIIAQH